MCILFLAYEQDAKFPLILAGNRDEYYQRPTAKAAPWKDYPGIFAGRDLVAMGTWLGKTDSGRFAALTNYRDPEQIRGTESRGALVADFLKTEMAPSEYLKDVDTRSASYTGFNLVVGEITDEASEVWYYSNRGGAPHKLTPGIYGLSNHLLDTPWPKVRRGKARFSALIEEGRINSESVFRFLADKELADDNDLPETGIGLTKERYLSPIFIETPIYGTRCSTLLTVSSEFETELIEKTYV